ncbi:hypothetical protein CEE37_03140 [candidate division LCP-89 bacterium B3_LCP]|uniref:Histidinol-phosphatase n=1 Tax=candidate division LCP-89 bacterium B3_LCP TaxID=2012998 RepID=A0A532V312_UNCL8|nr:MAG: hypothetical protein CEE37_03140 [candidate division LCP-89 bacterium B3_LCP]
MHPAIGTLRFIDLSAMIISDLHVHPSPWKFGEGTYRQFVKAALDRNVAILGFSEHGPEIGSDQCYRGLKLNEIGDYVESVLKLKEEFSGLIQIFCGLELSYHPDLFDSYMKLQTEFPFDYFLVSLHTIDDWHVDNPDSLSPSIHGKKTEKELYRLYYGKIIDAARCGLFDGFAHIDYLRRSLPHPPGEPPEYALEIYDEVAGEISRSNMTVEVNTRGFSIESMKEMYPTLPFVKKLVHAGVKFTTGSDAHEVGRVGDGLAKVRQLVAVNGIRATHYFKNREVLGLAL